MQKVRFLGFLTFQLTQRSQYLVPVYYTEKRINLFPSETIFKENFGNILQ